MLAAIAASAQRRSGCYTVTLGQDTHRVALEDVSGVVCDVRVDDGPTLRIDAAKTSRTPYSILLAGRQFECSVDLRPNGELDVRVGANTYTLTVGEAG